MNLSTHQPKVESWGDLELTTLGQGQGTFSLPGDPSPISRFVRIAFFRAHANVGKDEMSAITEFFHLLSGVTMIKGSVITNEGKDDLTLYTSCMHQEKGLYYYCTYNNLRLNVIDMHKENLDSADIKQFNFKDEPDTNYQN